MQLQTYLLIYFTSFKHILHSTLSKIRRRLLHIMELFFFSFLTYLASKMRFVVMGAIPQWLQNITFSLLRGWITDTHHKNQVAQGLKFQGPTHSNRPYGQNVSFTEHSLGLQFLLVKMTHCLLFFYSLVPSWRVGWFDVTWSPSHVEHFWFLW